MHRVYNSAALGWNQWDGEGGGGGGESLLLIVLRTKNYGPNGLLFV